MEINATHARKLVHNTNLLYPINTYRAIYKPNILAHFRMIPTSPFNKLVNFPYRKTLKLSLQLVGKCMKIPNFEVQNFPANLNSLTSILLFIVKRKKKNPHPTLIFDSLKLHVTLHFLSLFVSHTTKKKERGGS